MQDWRSAWPPLACKPAHKVYENVLHCQHVFAMCEGCICALVFAGPSDTQQLEALRGDTAQMQAHITKLEEEAAQQGAAAEQLSQKLNARAEKAEGKVKRLEAEADSLASQIAELQVRQHCSLGNTKLSGPNGSPASAKSVSKACLLFTKLRESQQQPPCITV